MIQPLGHLQIEKISLLPGQEWPVAAGAWHFALVQAGAAYWLGAHRNRSLAIGEMIVAGPKIEGNIRASQINEVVLHAFQFFPDLLSGFFTLAERHFFETACTDTFAEMVFYSAAHPSAQQFATIIAAPDEPQNLMRRAKLLGLVVAIFSDGMERQHPLAARSLSAHHRFQQLISRMPDTELINHTPEHLAGLCGCSPRHFSRLFQLHFGVSARERQTGLRLVKASQLLGNTEQTVAQVARACGYQNISLFNLLFKKRFGMTPSEWRKKAEAEQPRSSMNSSATSHFPAVMTGASPTQTFNPETVTQS